MGTGVREIFAEKSGTSQTTPKLINIIRTEVQSRTTFPQLETWVFEWDFVPKRGDSQVKKTKHMSPSIVAVTEQDISIRGHKNQSPPAHTFVHMYTPFKK